MTHLDDELLMALRDGTADPGEEAVARAHLAVCGACRGVLSAAERRREAVAAGLRALDTGFDAEAARAAVRARAVRPASRSHRGAWVRAAGLIVFLGAASAAAALPRSPVHDWVRRLLRFGTPVDTVAVPASPSAGASNGPETTGVRLDVGGGPLSVALRGVSAGTEIDVRWVPGSEAAVFAPVGSRFTSATGWLEARLVPGPVRVELPRASVPITLEVGGVVYLARTADGLTVTGPVLRRGEDAIAFRTPGG